MGSSWPKFSSQCKSGLAAIARSCFLGRRKWKEKGKKAKRLYKKVRQERENWKARCKQLERENQLQCEQISNLEAELLRPQPLKLPLGENPPGQQYGAGMITLCVNMARRIGLRPTLAALGIVFDWLEVEVEIPRFQTIRGWSQRIGLDRMQMARKDAGDSWLVDHTNQIGQEKVMAVASVDCSKWEAGVPLRHHDIEILDLVPGREWKREDVAKIYEQLGIECGVPVSIGLDGAVELREPVETLEKLGKKPFVFRDLKHYLANKWEALLKQDQKFEKFNQTLGGTRSALQQTELAHFIPPPFKMKARFMNLKPILTWASALLWHLDNPNSESRKNVSENRLLEKLGWLRDFATSIKQWQEAQEVISTALTFINEQGVFRGVVRQFEKAVAGLAKCPMSKQLVRKTVELLREYEEQLEPGMRLPMSTEILESSFGLYKQFEQQHSKSGFTGLLLAFPLLLRPTTPAEVRESFARVRVADVRKWEKEHLAKTLASKRQLMYREARRKNNMKPKKRATPLAAAA